MPHIVQSIVNYRMTKDMWKNPSGDSPRYRAGVVGRWRCIGHQPHTTQLPWRLVNHFVQQPPPLLIRLDFDMNGICVSTKVCEA